MSHGYRLRRRPVVTDGSTQYLGWFEWREEAIEHKVQWEIEYDQQGVSGDGTRSHRIRHE